MVTVYWLIQTQADLPGGYGWLARRERAALETLRIPKRRADWLCGRWTAKQAVRACIGSGEVERDRDEVRTREHAAEPGFETRMAPEWEKIEILAEADGDPAAFLVGSPLPLTISLSHRSGLALCAVAAGRPELGCDIEHIEPRSAGFIADYLTEKERALIEGSPEDARELLANLVWSAKESALKALRKGLRRDTRTLEVGLDSGAGSETPPDRWGSLAVRHAAGRVHLGWWRTEDGHIVTIVADPPPVQEPISLQGATTAP